MSFVPQKYCYSRGCKDAGRQISKSSIFYLFFAKNMLRTCKTSNLLIFRFRSTDFTAFRLCYAPLKSTISLSSMLLNCFLTGPYNMEIDRVDKIKDITFLVILIKMLRKPQNSKFLPFLPAEKRLGIPDFVGDQAISIF